MILFNFCIYCLHITFISIQLFIQYFNKAIYFSSGHPAYGNAVNLQTKNNVTEITGNYY